MSDNFFIITGDGQRLVKDQVHYGGGRYLTRLRSESDKRLDEALGPTLAEVRVEIIIAHNIDFGNLGYPYEASFCEKHPSTAENYDVTAWAMDKLDTLQKWKKGLKTVLHKKIADKMTKEGCSARQTAQMVGRDHKTIMKYLREALNDWAVLTGRGEQLKRVEEKHEMRFSGERPEIV